jgi:hypothetical protein
VAIANSNDWISLSPGDRRRLTSLGLSANAQTRVAQELSSGQLVVVPQPPVEFGSVSFVGWWRIDPVSGHTLGINEHGWGASLKEYALTFGVAFVGEWVFCSLLHEFVAVRRDGKAFGEATATHGLGRCIAAALAAGVLATLWLVVMTVSPRLFFRSWRGGAPGIPPPGLPNSPRRPASPPVQPGKPPVNPMAESHPGGPGAPSLPPGSKPPAGNPPGAPPSPPKPITPDDFHKARNDVATAIAESDRADRRFWDYRQKNEMYKDSSWNPLEDERLLNEADRAGQKVSEAIGSQRKLQEAYQQQRAAGQGLGGPAYGPPAGVSVPGGLPRGPLFGANKIVTGSAGVNDPFLWVWQ